MVNCFHITVDSSGEITVWRNKHDAQFSGQRYMLLLLTPQQQKSIENMRRVAMDPNMNQEAANDRKS